MRKKCLLIRGGGGEGLGAIWKSNIDDILAASKIKAADGVVGDEVAKIFFGDSGWDANEKILTHKLVSVCHNSNTRWERMLQSKGILKLPPELFVSLSERRWDNQCEGLTSFQSRKQKLQALRLHFSCLRTDISPWTRIQMKWVYCKQSDKTNPQQI